MADWDQKSADKDQADKIRNCISELAEAVRIATIKGLQVELHLDGIGYAGFGGPEAIHVCGVYRKFYV